MNKRSPVTILSLTTHLLPGGQWHALGGSRLRLLKSQTCQVRLPPRLTQASGVKAQLWSLTVSNRTDPTATVIQATPLELVNFKIKT